jgi:hypothetical protein
MNPLDLFDIWSNGGCLGYAEENRRIIDSMKFQFERYTVKEADKHYCDSVY